MVFVFADWPKLYTIKFRSLITSSSSCSSYLILLLCSR